MINEVVLIGRLTAEPELRKTKSGMSVCNVTLAVDEIPNANGQKYTNFIDVQIWNRQAENIVRYCSKGESIAVYGSIRTGKYKKDDRWVYTKDIIAKKVQFLTNKNAKAKTKEEYDVHAFDSDIPDNVMPWEI